MGVNTTPDLYKSLTFDGESSRNYGVYITGEAVFNAPVRAVEMINIPGRNGAFALDKGHFENIEVTYPAGIYADNEEDFAEAISDFRNFLCSRSGYCRLTDDYNADEYRLAIYKSGLEVEPAQLKAGEFNITFECKPQRFLTSGETAVSVANNGTLTNPTRFESKPLLQIWGYGNIQVNDDVISIMSEPIGTVIVANKTENSNSDTLNIVIDDTYANPGDSIYRDSSISAHFRVTLLKDIKSVSTTQYGGTTLTNTERIGSKGLNITEGFPPSGNGFTYGTATSYTLGVKHNIVYTDDSTDSFRNDFTLSYDGSSTITFSMTYANWPNLTNKSNISYKWFLDSTQTTLGTPLYFDIDIGEAYKIENDSVVSVNNGVSFPAKLPGLKPGNNTFIYPNTITQFKVVPRWWKV